MNKNILYRALLIASKQFKLLWGFITLLTLAYALYVTYQISYNHSYKDVVEVANHLSKSMDGLIEDLFQEVYTLPIYGQNIQGCPAGLNGNLQRISYNNTSISGLIVSDINHHIICSTIAPHSIELDPSSNKRARMLMGPFRLSLYDQPIFVIRQKIGSYYIDIIIVASLLKEYLDTSSPWVNSIVLYNATNKKNLLNIQRSEDSNHWILNTESSTPESDDLVVTDKIQSIDGVTIKVFANNEVLYHHILLKQILVTLLTLVISYILYGLITYNINRHYSLKRAIKSGIKEKQFYPEYQPLFDAQKNEFCGVELLVRWKDYDDNIMMPDFFIDEAESTGLIVPITLQIIETAFQEFHKLLKEYPDFHLAINLTVDHFQDPFFFKTFNLLLMQYNIAENQIVFEITERRLLDTSNLQFIAKMNQLRAANISLAIDDYGTGHASISYLQSFPFNYLKIDKMFIQAIGTKAITESLNDAIILMAKGLNLGIIAEGVETQEQVDYLVKNGVRYLQGWYFSKAVSIEKIKELLQGIKK